VASLIEGLKASRDLGCRFILIGLTTSTREFCNSLASSRSLNVYDNEEQQWLPDMEFVSQLGSSTLDALSYLGSLASLWSRAPITLWCPF